jgi:hypothetical protein
VEYLFGLDRETDRNLGATVHNLKDMIAEQTAEFAPDSLLGNQFDTAITSFTLGTTEVGFSHVRNHGGKIRLEQLARGPEDHEANGTDCETDPNGGAIFRNPDVCFLFLFHMSPSEWARRSGRVGVLLSSVRTDQPEIKRLACQPIIVRPKACQDHLALLLQCPNHMTVL